MVNFWKYIYLKPGIYKKENEVVEDGTNDFYKYPITEDLDKLYKERDDDFDKHYRSKRQFTFKEIAEKYN